VLQSMKAKFAVVATLTVIATAVVLGAQHYFHCHSGPVPEEEAQSRAKARVEKFKKSFGITEQLTLSERHFDPASSSWLFTFSGNACSVIITVDACHGDEVGSSSACNVKNS